MNWKTIKGKSPQAFRVLENKLKNSYYEYYYDEGCEDFRAHYDDNHFIDRDLYDFFDEQELCITITTVGLYNNLEFEWHIQDKGLFVASDQRYYPTRTEAEEQAFLRAFQLLEEKLKEGK